VWLPSGVSDSVYFCEACVGARCDVCRDSHERACIEVELKRKSTRPSLNKRERLRIEVFFDGAIGVTGSADDLRPPVMRAVLEASGH
jgi:hypothetical protein